MHDELVDCKEEDKEYVRSTIYWDDEPLFHVDLDAAALREDKMTDILDAIEDENEEDTPLMFRSFVHELLGELRLKLFRGIKDDDILLRDIELTFPVLNLGVVRWIATLITIWSSGLRDRGGHARQ
jgi:hypothetical protein